MCDAQNGHAEQLMGVIAGAGKGMIRFNKDNAAYNSDAPVDDEGQYATTIPLTKGTYKVYYRKKGSGEFKPIEPHALTANAHVGRCPQNFAVPAIALTGVVTDAQGAPVQDPQLIAFGGSTGHEAWTMADGTYAVSLSPGTYTITVNEQAPLEVIVDGDAVEGGMVDVDPGDPMIVVIRID